MVVEPDAARRHLEDEHTRLEQVRASVENDNLHDESEEESSSGLARMVLQHPADVGSDAFEREKVFSILEQVQAELNDVERALVRLDEGRYGICEACEEAIADERLAAVPATRFCIQHQPDAET